MERSPDGIVVSDPATGDRLDYQQTGPGTYVYTNVIDGGVARRITQTATFAWTSATGGTWTLAVDYNMASCTEYHEVSAGFVRSE